MQKRLISGNYKKAFNCKRCPQSNGEEGCPLWWETIQTNIQTGEECVTKGCGYQQLPVYLTEVIKASNRPAEEISKIREKAVEKIASITKNASLQIKNND
jgi:hypothetical protein